ncbi:MAG: TIGR02117 family protein [Bacteroidota bacterium]
MIKKIIKIFKLLAYSLLVLLLMILIYLATAFFLSIYKIDSSTEFNDRTIDIFILSNGVHADIAVPVKSKEIDWSETIKFDNTFSKDSVHKYVAFGWGDRKFYLETPTWDDLRIDVAFQALFLSGKSAIHATFFQDLRETESSIKLSISSGDYKLLINYINNQLQKDKSGNPIPIENLYYGLNDTFYEASGTFTLFYTCNTWANDALKISNQKACLWTPFVQGIFYHYDH